MKALLLLLIVFTVGCGEDDGGKIAQPNTEVDDGRGSRFDSTNSPFSEDGYVPHNFIPNIDWLNDTNFVNACVGQKNDLLQSYPVIQFEDSQRGHKYLFHSDLYMHYYAGLYYYIDGAGNCIDNPQSIIDPHYRDKRADLYENQQYGYRWFNYYGGYDWQ